RRAARPSWRSASRCSRAAKGRLRTRRCSSWLKAFEGYPVASVELRGLTKNYGPNAVVDNISMTIDHGTLVCLLGPSGCGKTTTLGLIAGFRGAHERRNT